MLFIKANRLVQFIFLFAALAYGVGCTPVVSHWNPQDYTVKSGDTLYSIAWRYEKDFRAIARWNDIGPPYAIYPGQRLRMAPDSAEGTVDPVEADEVVIDESPLIVEEEPVVEIQPEPMVVVKPSSIQVKKGDTLYSLSREYDIEVKRLARWNALRSPYRLYPGQRLRLSPPTISNRPSVPVLVEAPAISKAKKPEAVAPKPKSTLPKRVKQWQWPVAGKVVKSYSRKDTTRRGIGISGKKGQSVKAAAAGEVVYSGNGLISYGNLVIIKHSNSFLSAYAHNEKLLVKEGQAVSAGAEHCQYGDT